MKQKLTSLSHSLKDFYLSISGQLNFYQKPVDTTYLSHMFFFACTLATGLIVLYLVGYIFNESLLTFNSQGIINFITGTEWNYDENVYGIGIFIIGTVIITVVSLIIAVPVSLFTSIFLVEYASSTVSGIVRPLIELLVGIPSVVYGVFGAYILGDLLRFHIEPFLSGNFGDFIFLFHDFNPGNATGVLLASIVLAIMILPTITSLSEDAIRSVAKEYREASYSVGATQWETIRNVVLPTASGGIIASIVLGMMRAMGETMAIVMLLGNTKKIPGSLFDTGYAMTSKILNDIGYYVAMDEPRSALFGIAAVLFAIEIVFVAIAKKVARYA